MAGMTDIMSVINSFQSCLFHISIHHSLHCTNWCFRQHKFQINQSILVQQQKRLWSEISVSSDCTIAMTDICHYRCTLPHAALCDWTHVMEWNSQACSFLLETNAISLLGSERFIQAQDESWSSTFSRLTSGFVSLLLLVYVRQVSHATNQTAVSYVRHVIQGSRVNSTHTEGFLVNACVSPQRRLRLVTLQYYCWR